jgi:hypothetical protein
MNRSHCGGRGLAATKDSSRTPEPLPPARCRNLTGSGGQNRIQAMLVQRGLDLVAGERR